MTHAEDGTIRLILSPRMSTIERESYFVQMWLEEFGSLSNQATAGIAVKVTDDTWEG
jgi:hypothetical protein